MRIGMVAAQVAIEAGGAFHRAGRALVERDALRQQAGGDEAIEMAFGRFEAIDVGDEFHSQGFQRFAKPFVGGEIAAQAPGTSRLRRKRLPVSRAFNCLARSSSSLPWASPTLSVVVWQRCPR